MYRGVFGSHVANVLRRLRRVAAVVRRRAAVPARLGDDRQPGRARAALIGEAVDVVDRDGAPRAERTIALWNPPLIDPELGLRGSALGEAARLLAELVEQELRTICFTKSRKAAELIHRFARERLGRDLAERLSPYRAGYTPAQRREIERRLVEGELLGVTATDALELGIDIGLLDCAISVGFPGTVASLRQQWGRAGRREAGLAVLVASEDALDQFFMREPEALLSDAAPRPRSSITPTRGSSTATSVRPPSRHRSRTGTGPSSELPPSSEPRRWPTRGELRAHRAGYAWAGRDYPAGRLSLRSTSAGAIAVLDDRHRAGARLGGGGARAVDGARGRGLPASGRVVSRALARPRRTRQRSSSPSRATTTPRRSARRSPRSRRSTARSSGWASTLASAGVSVTEHVIAFQKRSIRTQEAFDLVALDLPPHTFDTEAVWFCPEAWMLDGLERMPTLLGTLHAAEHSLIALLPLWAMCDRWDIGGLSTNLHPQTGLPTIFVYDGHPGGVGITERGFERFEGWTEDTVRMLDGCPCERGCPSCVQSPEMRQPQRAARQGGSADPAAPHARECRPLREGPSAVRSRRRRATPQAPRPRQRSLPAWIPSPSIAGPWPSSTTGRPSFRANATSDAVPHSPPTAITASPLATTARLRACPIPVATA